MSSDTEKFANAVLNAEAWLRQAEQFYFAAEHISSAIRLDGSRTSTDGLALSVGALKATLLLLAFAVENALKSVKAKKGMLRVYKGQIQGLGGKGGHDLPVLADEAGIELSAEESRLLRRLTKIGKWAGRYQQPRDVEEFMLAQTDNPRRITLPSDFDIANRLIARVKEVVEGV